MKVLQITTNYPCKENPVFGIFMKEQVESLEPLGVKNTVLFSNGLKKPDGAMRVHMLSAVKLFFHLLTHRYDVVHCHSVISGLILYVSGGAFFNKCVLSLQNDPTFGRGSDTRYFKRLYKHFNKVIVKMPVHTDMPKIEYLPNGVNLDFFQPMDRSECKRQLGLDEHKRYILFVDSNSGKKRTQKRRDRFDDTLEILRTKYGHTDVEPLEMIGVKREMVPTYINACDMHLLSSDQEGSPNSVKECMACNVPCVTTPVGNVADLFHGVDGCYFSEHFEADELAALAHRVLTDATPKDFRTSLVNNGLDQGSVAKRLMTIYSEL